MNGKIPTILDIAKAVGVTDGTVSRALRGDTRVREETRRRVLEAAKQLGYRPNQSARGLKEGRQSAVGIFCDGGSWMINNSYFGRLLAGVAEAAEAKSQRAVIYLPEVESPDGNPEHDIVRLRGVDALAEGRVDSALVLGGRLTDEESLARLRDLGMPTVILGSDREVPGFSQVTSGMSQRARLAGEALLEAGRRRLGYLGLFRGSVLNEECARVLGNLAGTRVGGGLEMVEMDHFDITNPAEIRPRLEALLKLGIDGLVVANEDQCANAMELLRQMGVKVPEELSVISFGRPYAMRAFSPPLAYVEADLEWEGRKAFGLLQELHEGQSDLVREFEWRLVRPHGRNTLQA